MNYIDALNWRYAVKEFSEKKLLTEQLDGLKEAVRLSASAYGIQPYRLFIIENDSIKKDCVPFSYGQDKVANCSHLLVFANQTNVVEQDIASFISEVAENQGVTKEKLLPYHNSICQDILSKTQLERAQWSEQQCYIALGNLLSYCAIEQIDACPMTGFDRMGINQVLGLNELGLNAAILCPVGYRSDNDVTAQRKKYRKSLTQLVTTV